MASDPSEFGDEAAGDELRGVSCMLHKGVQTVVVEWMGRVVLARELNETEGDQGRQRKVRERGTHASPSSMSASSSPPARAKSSSSISSADMVR
jgi:hypothetical protein